MSWIPKGFLLVLLVFLPLVCVAEVSDTIPDVDPSTDAISALTHFMQRASRLVESVVAILGLHEMSDEATSRPAWNANAARPSPSRQQQLTETSLKPPLDPPVGRARKKLEELDWDDFFRLDSETDSAGTQPPTSMSELRWPCGGGFRAVSPLAQMHCWRTNTNVTMLQYVAMSVEERRTCAYVPKSAEEEVCVCPASHIWMIYSGLNSRGSQCVPRRLLLTPRLKERYLCVDPIAKSLGLQRGGESDFCLLADRHAKLRLEVNMSFRWLRDEEMVRYLSANGGGASLGPLQRKKPYVTLSPVAFGTYEELERSSLLFYFLFQPTLATSNAFIVTQDHPLTQKSFFEEIIYPFAAPHLMTRQQRIMDLTPEKIEFFFGRKETYILHTITWDLSKVEDAFISGNMMYMEVGFTSEGVPFSHRYARIWITLENMTQSKKRFHYSPPWNPIVVAAITIAIAFIVGLTLAIIWMYCDGKKIEMDDTLLTEPHTSEEEKKQQ